MTSEEFHKQIIETRQKVWDALEDHDYDSARKYIRKIQKLDREWCIGDGYDLTNSDPD